MEDGADLHDWELVVVSVSCNPAGGGNKPSPWDVVFGLGARFQQENCFLFIDILQGRVRWNGVTDLTDNHMAIVVLVEDTPSGAIKDGYFAFDSGRSQLPQSEEESDEGGIDSDNPSSVEPDSDSNTFLETSREQLGIWNLETWRILLCKWDLKRVILQRENLGEENEGRDNSDSRDLTEIGGDAGVTEGEKREKIWWKVPLGLLKYFLIGMRPVWSISIAAAVVGIVVL
ncbi:hypothetical protein IEQ34_004547 [Dendrobium chrysotoxum]|uniref:Uncharacterized protein n=1 Tax=Dendrobium chrysotoxum TaxID=161865 RepID=A0AAV7H0M1_DENCH|nr:hypothetical protein IEQ34_004547 [Dendrobium chrysotoxum]